MSSQACFHLDGSSYVLKDCVLLYRGEETLVVTPDERLVLLGAGAPKRLTGLEARRFLVAHGELELVEEFPDLFRATSKTASTASPEPTLFPLH